MKKLMLMVPLLIVMVLSSCQREMDISSPPSNLKMMVSFKFTKADNPILKTDITGKIDEYQKTILLTLPVGTNVAALKPIIIISPKSTVLPENLLPQNFSSAIDYTVSAQNNTSVFYTITVVFK